MTARAMYRFGAGPAGFARVLTSGLVVLAVLEIATGVIGGVLLILHETHTCGGEGELYVLRCTTSSPYIVLGAAVIVGTIAQGALLLMAGAYIHKRADIERDGRLSDEPDD